ncbi:DUF433 domain-containing protein [Roseibium sp. Sym1]|uniref:DUF433 domain-containing protein n=1 Tax=Roseibium sp. Sym1 TaxID=3016006 RepID=UPI0022B37CB9|nr:DUF433 domain-containing protein [Roseibium sp. Sym1]
MTQGVENVVAALSEDQVSKITELSKGQLRAWDRRGFFVPRYAYDNRSVAYSRIYSFRDAVGLRTLAKLRSTYKIRLARLENLAKEMEKDGISHWADARVWVVKGEPHYLRPKQNEVKGAETGQLAMLPIIDVIEEVKSRVEDLKKRSQETIGKVERHKYIARNSWVISGTRIPTATIRRYHEAGFTSAQILEEYPTLTEADIVAALAHEKELALSA